jgi:hypothetical protein
MKKRVEISLYPGEIEQLKILAARDKRSLKSFIEKICSNEIYKHIE